MVTKKNKNINNNKEEWKKWCCNCFTSFERRFDFLFLWIGDGGIVSDLI